MTVFPYKKEDGTFGRIIRDDAVCVDRISHRYAVPTTSGTKWVSNMEEFREAGGDICFNEDQTEIELLLPEPYKFSIQMFR